MPVPKCSRVPGTDFALGGPLRQYVDAVTEHWLKPAPEANPAMLEMFRDRDRAPGRNLTPWAGEFAGKYLTGATQVLRLTRDAGLRARLDSFVGELVSLQAEDGYLGPWPRAWRLTNRAPAAQVKGEGTWDTWGHYHLMLGLLLWHEEMRDRKALRCVRRIADAICAKYLGGRVPRLVETGSTEMNLAPAHSLALLYQATGVRRYLQMAQQIVAEFAARPAYGRPLAGDYLNTALAGKEFFETPKPRWESLHPIMSLAELYYITGDERCRRAFEHIWWSIAKLDRHNNGGFSSGEQAQGNPYHSGAIETCCTIAWMALSVEMLRLTANPVVADELELSMLNSVLGMHSPSGRWATYNTPMNGTREASAHTIVFQSRPGAPELNCCSVNSARGFGLLSDWAAMRDADGLYLNWYGPGRIGVPLARGLAVALTQETAYPVGGRVLLRVEPSRAARFILRLRIPHWSWRTRVSVNGRPVQGVQPGRYLALDRVWKRGDRVAIMLDMSLHYWAGEQECAGKVSLYRGPLLLAYDRRFHDVGPKGVPELDMATVRGRLARWPGPQPPILLLAVTDGTGRSLRLCDFASAGQAGSPYQSWFPAVNAVPTPFSVLSPWRSRR